MAHNVHYKDDIRDTYALQCTRYVRRPQVFEVEYGQIYNMGRISDWDRIEHFQRANVELEPKQLKALRKLRTSVRTQLIERGYVLQKDSIDDEDIEEATRYPLSFCVRDKTVPCAGIDHFWGMVEMPHAPLLRDVIQRARERMGRVMDLGCGFFAHSKYNIEQRMGIKQMTYVSNSQDDLDILMKHMPHVCGKNDERRFVLEDKDTLSRSIDPDSHAAVVRLGVYETSEQEMRGLHTIMQQDAELFVSNSLERQPVMDFLKMTERYFDDIDVHIGLSRYAAVIKKK